MHLQAQGQLTYTLLNPHGYPFAVEVVSCASATNALNLGQSCVKLKTTGALDYDTAEMASLQRKYRMQLQVQDSHPWTTVGDVVITIEDVNEAPVVTQTEQAAYVPENLVPGAEVVARLNATDPESLPLEFSIEGGDGQGVFEVADALTGKLVLASGQSLDFEDKVIYTLNMRVTDTDSDGNGRKSNTFVVKVHVQNVNDVTFNATMPFLNANYMHPTGTPEAVVLRGSNFGATKSKRDAGSPTPDSKIIVEYGRIDSQGAWLPNNKYTATGCVFVEPYGKAISCNTVQGIGTDLYWRVTIDGDTSPLSPATTSYKAPSITGVSGAGSLSTGGGDLITVSGNDFGAARQLPQGVVYAISTCGNNLFDNARSARRFIGVDCEVKSHTSIECKSASGVGGANGLYFQVLVGGQKNAVAYHSTSSKCEFCSICC